ncbi:MAG: precorrin-4 C(11)-methyltransferase [Magnetococcales bacterium]|nr:precorrin-4 C(11)-methyltransferase [Magnetococcales bacterium]
MADTVTGKVWFVGAGPGDPDLITVRGRSLLERAGAVLYAGSLVSPAHFTHTPEGCTIADSSGMTLDEMTNWLRDEAGRCEVVVRLQTGDPSLYGALAETAGPLDEAGVAIGVVPGVTSAMASAAVAGESLTLPERTQTVILTRTEGRTPMPDGEKLHALAAHGATLCLYLSATLMEKVTEELIQAGWSAEAPVLVVHKASWPGEERVLRTTVGSFAALCTQEGIRSQTMIIVSKALGARQRGRDPQSRLYAPEFTHGFRTGHTHSDSSG